MKNHSYQMSLYIKNTSESEGCTLSDFGDVFTLKCQYVVATVDMNRFAGNTPCKLTH